MNQRLESRKTISNFILYALGFLLVWEWLRPIEQLTNTGHIAVFIFFLLIALILAFLQVPPILSGGIKGIYILFMLQHLYDESSFLSFHWISMFLEEISANFAIMFDTNWPEMSNLFKSLLFFILLWLMCYLIDYWLIKKRRIFTFLLLTMIYITVLDTFTPYSANESIIRTVIIGFIIMGMLTFLRLKDREGGALKERYLFKWMLPLLVFVAISSMLGYLAPKAEPTWPDPVPFIQSLNENAGGINETKGNQRVGYSVDDSQLGGSFKGDDTVVFQAQTSIPHYWKVETKDTYTGKGWIQSEQSIEANELDKETVEEGAEIPFVSFEEGGKVKFAEYKSSVEFEEPFSYLLYPLGVESIIDVESTLELEKGIERITPTFPVKSYSVRFNKPEYSLEALTTDDFSTFVQENQEMAQRYLQLPDTLPKRVIDLAAEITENEDNAFSKARAIEKYFSQNGFVYSKENVAVPSEEDDYVDQFLFETKSGYCDNYSTSMVTLLRSIGIPARWVKGFTEGEAIKKSTDGDVYEVTNNNAHSWVEAYFPNVGWVSFEPTQGFANENTYVNDVQNEINQEESNQQTEEQEEQQAAPENPQTEEQQTAFTEKEEFSVWDAKAERFAEDNWKWLMLGATLILAISMLLYRYRYKWLPHYYIWKFNHKKTSKDFPEAYLVLLKVLEIYGVKKEKNSTLREYAKQIDHLFDTDEMAILTANYEEFLYKGAVYSGDRNELMELWENLIKKTTA
ncbi:DUF3488 and DUF4129 domain-containing transglutaminase family protein [Niallia sp. NCCP-28]|uniref:transglutaminase TgpA family protein n=1 Tax=Niallia sp. NCCP-28 TaxID=2934712 RepID=UPI002084A617|nr:transglutaminaseTgpA domain-containing protein [Niallia sp. NCCP-28]GKU85271.1 hypothetical protein NCCP28_46670 [Niallia sp. NCCP-28]